MADSGTDAGTAALGDLVMRLARALRRRSSTVLAPWELSPHQARALRAVCSRDGVRLSELAEALRIAPRSATEVVDVLQQRDLVERTPDPTDRRAVLLRATGEGHRVQRAVTHARAADSDRFFGRLPEEDRAALARALTALLADGEADPGAPGR